LDSLVNLDRQSWWCKCSFDPENSTGSQDDEDDNDDEEKDPPPSLVEDGDKVSHRGKSIQQMDWEPSSDNHHHSSSGSSSSEEEEDTMDTNDVIIEPLGLIAQGIVEFAQPEPRNTRTPIAGDIWNWFGNHGTFIGGLPSDGEDYTSSAILDLNRTPFARLWAVSIRIGPDTYSCLALRLLRNPGNRISDEHERIIPRDSMDGDALLLYDLSGVFSEDIPPRPITEVKEADFIREFGGQILKWVTINE
jgi:hypothetical protein